MFVAIDSSSPVFRSQLGAPWTTCPLAGSTVEWQAAHVMPARMPLAVFSIFIPTIATALADTSSPVSTNSPSRNDRPPTTASFDSGTRRLVVGLPPRAAIAVTNPVGVSGPSSIPTTSVR